MAGVVADFKIVDTFQGQHKEEAYTSENPASSIPMITHGNFKILGEGASIYSYLVQKFPEVRTMFYNEEQTQVAQAMFSHFMTSVRKTTKSMIRRVTNTKVFKKS